MRKVKVQLLRPALRWIGQRGLDALTGIAMLVCIAVALGVISLAISSVVQGPQWARWTVLGPALLILLVVAGRTWRRPDTSRCMSAHRTSPPMGPGYPLPSRVVYDTVTDARSLLDGRMAALSDEELRAQGVQNPAAMRCMGFGRYCEMVARRELAADVEATAAKMREAVRDRRAMERVVPLSIVLPGEEPGDAFPAPCNCQHVQNPPCANCEHGLVDPDNPRGDLR